MNEKSTGESIMVDGMVRWPYHEATGIYLGKFFKKIRDEEELWANRCPKCGRIRFPPRIVCGYCKSRIEDKPENWLRLSNKGTVLSYFITAEREVDPSTGKVYGQPNPTATIQLDGGDSHTILGHALEETDPEKLKEGMRVQAVWRPKEERTGKISDILYFRTIKE